jgi:hypothetical protein
MGCARKSYVIRVMPYGVYTIQVITAVNLKNCGILGCSALLRYMGTSVPE